MNNIKIAGCGSVAGGEYGEVKIAGSGHVLGALRCESFSASGSAHADGDIQCVKDCKFSGSCRVDGSIKCTELKVAGSARVNGGVTASEVKIAGSAKIGGGIEADRAIMHGSIEVAGMVNAEFVEIKLSSDCSADSVGCTVIEVKREFSTSKILGFISVNHGRGRFSANTIEGDTINIEYTDANLVRGKDITIGEGCRIGKIEYTGSCTVADGAKVGETVKI